MTDQHLLFSFVAFYLSTAALCFSFFMMGRNEAVHHFLLRMLAEEHAYLQANPHLYDGNFHRIDSLPSYNKILLKFWVPLGRYRQPLEMFYAWQAKERAQ